MKRLPFILVLLAAALLVAPVVRADVKMQQKDSFKFGGTLGAVLNRVGGSTTNEGTTTSVAIKGDRKLQLGPSTGLIVDLGEQKTYLLDVKGKTYRVMTFAEMRAAWEKAKADAEQKKSQMKPEEKQQMEEPQKQYVFDADVKETGQHKSIAGYDAREVIVTVTAHEKDKKVEDSGGLIITSDLWLAPKIAAVDEVTAFNLKYVQAVYGPQFVTDVQQLGSTMAMYPSLQPMTAKLHAESAKLQGTVLMSTTTFDSIKSAEEMKDAQQPQQSSDTSTSSIGSSIAKRMMGSHAQPQQRSNVFTSTHEVLSVAPSASADDVAMPAGYKEKK